MGHYSKISTWLIALSLSFFVLGLFSTAQKSFADTFKADEKKQIESIIRDYLIKNPEILKEVIQALEKKEQAQADAQRKTALTQNAKWLFNSPKDFVAGNKNGDITLVEFFDYNCGYCKRAVTELLGLIKKDPKLRVVLKEMPILGPESVYASQAALASKKQGKYWDYHLAMLQNEGPNNKSTILRIAKEVGLNVDQLQKDMLSPDILKQLADIEQKSTALGIRSTPAFILDDQVYPGALPQQVLVKLVSDLRKNGGCKLC